MTRILQSISLALIFVFCIGSSNAQFINYKDDSGWNLGLNIGGTWQQGDLEAIPGLGYGFTFGKALYEKEGKLLSFDLRFRYLRAKNSGFSDILIPVTDSTGPFSEYFAAGHFTNYEMDLKEYDLEGVITLNRLRENTGLILYGFGGIGLTDYKIKADLIDESGNPYDYTGLLTQGSASLTDLDLLTDGNYETEIYDELKFMPHLGAGIGYQFTPRFSAGLEHKIAFALNDQIDLVSDNQGSFVNDRYHYTGLVLRWNLFRGGSRTKPPVTNNPTPADPIPAPVVSTPTVNKPIVNIINPMHSPHTTHNSHYTIKANVYYVEGKEDIVFKLNGAVNTNFTYNPSTKRLESHIYLYPGQNVIEITGFNIAGSDTDSKIIIFEQEIIQIPPPIVTFTNPNYSPKEVIDAPFTVTAAIMNIDGASAITYKVNGAVNPVFNYNVSNKIFSSNITLHEGNNIVEIKAVNSVGQDIEQAIIIYKKPIQLRPPVVTITNPNTNPKTVTSALYNVFATAQYVDFQSHVSVTLNGANVPYFNFNTATKQVSFQASLMEGSNIITVTGTNHDGTDSDTKTIIYDAPQQLPPPIVTITNPTDNPHTTYSASVDVFANVLHVAGKSNISLKINGVASSNFTYNVVSKVMVISTALVEGSNTFSITATNIVGTDNAGSTIIYKKPIALKPPVVQITQPISNPSNTVIGNEIINATILNVVDASHVSAKFNGLVTNMFTYDPGTKKFSYNATLIPGANVLEITAWNDAGSASKSQTIIFTNEAPPCDNPVITIKQPLKNPVFTSNSKGAILANISGASSVLVKINGVNSPGFNFNSATGEFQLFINSLNEGANIYEIIATNACGSSSSKISYIYKKEAPPCVAPIVELSSPNSYNTTTNNATFTFAVFVRNIASSSGAKVLINGSPVVFNYDATTTLVTGSVTLKKGSNSLVISGTNDCGTDKASVTVTLKQMGDRKSVV